MSQSMRQIYFRDYARITYTKTGDTWLEPIPVDKYETYTDFMIEFNPVLTIEEKAEILDMLIQEMHTGKTCQHIQPFEWEQLHINVVSFLRNYLPVSLCDKLLNEMAKAGGLHEIVRKMP